MSMTAAFFDELSRRAGTDDRPFVDANEIADQLIEDIARGDMIDVRLTEQGIAMARQQK